MKKSLLALAALGAFAGAASAQSSVTLFGIVDLSANNFKNGSTQLRSMNSNQLNSNRLGFRGVEDLGGGLLASFWLEGGMANENGNAAGLTFTRRSTVSLTGRFGEIRLGRDYDVTFNVAASGDAYGANGMGSPWNIYLGTVANLGSGATTAVRANNMVGYFLPSGLGGVYGSLQAAAGQGVAGNKFAGGRLGYGAGPIDISAAYSETDVASPLGKYKVGNISGSYDFGVVKIYGLLDQRKFSNLKYNTYSLSGSVPLGQGEFRAAYTRGNASGGAISANDSTVWGVEYIYNLSKRTAVYTQYGRLTNDGGAALSLGGVGAGAGLTSSGYGVGLRHIF